MHRDRRQAVAVPLFGAPLSPAQMIDIKTAALRRR